MAVKTAGGVLQQYMRKNTFEIYRLRSGYPRDAALHHHDFYEIYFFHSGSVKYHVESRSYLLSPGDVLLIGPNELHQPIFGQDSQSYERVVLWINKDFLRQMSRPGEDLSACFDTQALHHTNLLHPVGNARQALNYQLEQLMLESEAEGYLSQVSALCHMIQVLVQLNRLAVQEVRQPEQKVMAGSAVYGVLDYINNHYSEDLTLDQLSNRFFISKYHLSREFGRLVGTSVHRYIIQKRLVIAKQLMSDGMASTEVYLHCGFGDYSNFYRAFKAEYGMTPKEFAGRTKESASQNKDLGAFLRLAESR